MSRAEKSTQKMAEKGNTWSWELKCVKCHWKYQKSWSDLIQMCINWLGIGFNLLLQFYWVENEIAVWCCRQVFAESLLLHSVIYQLSFRCGSTFHPLCTSRFLSVLHKNQLCNQDLLCLCRGRSLKKGGDYVYEDIPKAVLKCKQGDSW